MATIFRPVITASPALKRFNRDTDWIVPSLMDGGFMPFGQADWPNPQRSRRPVAVLDFVQQSRAFYVTAPPPVPFNQDDWPNPQAAKRALDQDWLVPAFWSPGAPFSQTDWPNPQRSRPSTALQDCIEQAPVFLVTPAAPQPFNGADWSRPRARRSAPPDFVQQVATFYVTPAVPLPFSQDDWPLASRRVARDVAFYPFTLTPDQIPPAPPPPVGGNRFFVSFGLGAPGNPDMGAP